MLAASCGTKLDQGVLTVGYGTNADRSVKSSKFLLSGFVGLISSMGTTVPNSPLDKLGYGQILFHELNLETDISESRRHDDVIEKQFDLTMAEGGQKELFVGHDVLLLW